MKKLRKTKSMWVHNVDKKIKKSSRKRESYQNRCISKAIKALQPITTLHLHPSIA